MNILLTSVGRRAYMVKYFKEVLMEDGEVHVCNSDDNTVAFCYADKCVISPLIYSEEYIPFLLEYCKVNKIDVLISLFDMDLLILARNKDRFLEVGTRVVVSDASVIEVCNDKWKTYQFLKENNFHVPKTYLSLDDALRAIKNKQLEYPLVVKPRFGCGSISVSIAENETDLVYYYNKSERMIRSSYLKYESSAEEHIVIVQECLKGQEYGADIINDLDGNICQVNLRKKIAMRAGETDVAQTIDNKKIEKELMRLGGLTKHIANMDADIFLVNDVPYILELNARFGGGYPFCHVAGCNLPLAIINWISGMDVPEEILKSKEGIKGFKELYITPM